MEFLERDLVEDSTGKRWHVIGVITMPYRLHVRRWDSSKGFSEGYFQADELKLIKRVTAPRYG